MSSRTLIFIIALVYGAFFMQSDACASSGNGDGTVTGTISGISATPGGLITGFDVKDSAGNLTSILCPPGPELTDILNDAARNSRKVIVKFGDCALEEGKKCLQGIDVKFGAA